MDLDDFELELAVLEIRYEPSYLHWDRVGSLWMKAIHNWRTLKAIEANPAKTIFRLDLETTYELVTEIAQSRVLAHRPKRNLEEFSNVVAFFVGLVVSTFEIDEYTRVGVRFVFARTYPTPEEAAEQLLQTGMMKCPQGPFFGFEGKATIPRYALRWEGEERGTLVQLRAETQKIETTPPASIPDVEPLSKESHRLVVDFDYYTRKPVGIGQLESREWIKQVNHVIRRDSSVFMGGLGG